MILSDSEKIEIQEAIDGWKRAAKNPANARIVEICLNAAKELEIERDTGEIVHINRRTS